MADTIYTIAAGAVGLGALHGAEPGHGWPLAASYAMRQSHRYRAGFIAGLLLGLGHLLSSMVVVLVFYGAKTWFGLEQSPWMNEIAGLLLIALGIWSWRSANNHNHEHYKGPTGGNEEKGLYAIVGAAFLLGFAHEEEFQIIGLCAGSQQCLELMLAYAITVLLVITALTIAVVAGFERWRHRLGHIEPYLPRVTAVILIVMGIAFAAGWV